MLARKQQNISIRRIAVEEAAAEEAVAEEAVAEEAVAEEVVVKVRLRNAAEMIKLFVVEIFINYTLHT